MAPSADGYETTLCDRRRRPKLDSFNEARRIVEWYFQNVYERCEGPTSTPFYCSPAAVGHFAVSPDRLARGDDSSLFRLFIGLAMFQARRDVVIMAQQQAMKLASVRSLVSPAGLRRRIRASTCSVLGSASEFDQRCDVHKRGAEFTCRLPDVECHVKEASALMRRMGDMGKLPTSAFLHLSQEGGLTRRHELVLRQESDPHRRAILLVEELARVYRVGRKLATMFVSALSVPALAPGLTPWYPAVDGYELVVVDTNVAQAVSVLSGKPMTVSDGGVAKWIESCARTIDFTTHRAELPPYSPRLLQQAMYHYRSKSNRTARGDLCAQGRCGSCIKAVCPFAFA